MPFPPPSAGSGRHREDDCNDARLAEHPPQAADHDAVVRRQYDSATQAQAYLDSSVHAAGADLELIAQRVGTRPEAVALDMGCGGGHVAFRLAPLVAKVVACDLSAQMLAAVADESQRRGYANLVTKQSAAESLPCPDASFDIAATRYSAHHWRDIAAGLRQMARTLKPGGLGLFADVITPGQALLDTWLQSVELLRDPSHVRNASLAEWHSLLADAGLRVEEAHTFRLRLDFAAWIARMRTPAPHVVAIRSLQACAGREVRDYFEFGGDGSFTVDSALIVARKV